jgi:pilus assembly protein CpaE
MTSRPRPPLHVVPPDVDEPTERRPSPVAAKARPAFVPVDTIVPVVRYATIEQARPQLAPVPPPVAHGAALGELVVVLGCRGGAGATTLAINAAAQLVRGGRSACVVDLDLRFGDVLVALDLEAPATLSSVAHDAPGLDRASLHRRLAHHRSGLCVLAEGDVAAEPDLRLTARLPGLFDALRRNLDVVVVDGIRHLDEVAAAALAAATQIVVVVTPDVPSVRRAARMLGALDQRGVGERVRLVVNRATPGHPIDDAVVARALGRPVALRLEDDGLVGAALDTGAPFVELATARPLGHGLAALAGMIDPRCALPRPPRRRWWQRRGA